MQKNKYYQSTKKKPSVTLKKNDMNVWLQITIWLLASSIIKNLMIESLFIETALTLIIMVNRLTDTITIITRNNNRLIDYFDDDFHLLYI